MIIGAIIDSLLITGIVALASFGLAIIFGLTGVINMGHGAMLTLGAYITWYGTLNGMPFALAVVLAALVVGLVGLVLEHLIIRHFYSTPFETLLLTWGFFLVTTEVIKIVFGTDLHTVALPITGNVTIFDHSISSYRLFLFFATLALLAGIAALFFYTRVGLILRALIQNRDVASLLGVNVGLSYKGTFFLGSFITGLAGGLICPLLSISPTMGNLYLVRSFFVVIVGGIGQLFAGTMLGSFIVGGSETLLSLLANQSVSQTIVFMIAIMVLRLRPAGLIGRHNLMRQ